VTEVGTEALRLLTVRQVADLLNYSEKTVYRLIWAADRGEELGLEAVTVGTRSRRVAPEAVAEYKARLRDQAGKPAAPPAA
jgi:excisionase family DNA binding protein